MKLGLFGFGSHGGDIYEQWSRDQRYRATRDTLLIFDENPDLGHDLRPPEGLPCFIGINNPWERRRAAERLRTALAPPLVDPSAIVGTTGGIGGSSVVAARALLLQDVFIGEHTHVNYMASMTRVAIGDFVTICPAVTICGDVEIGSNVLIGAGATICNLVSIGSNVIIGAGAMIPPDTKVADGTVMMGVPAKPRSGVIAHQWSFEI